ncbi:MULTISPECIES: helix-turn-helix domain-containing protein [Nitratireductor]|uniref:helix-turn-helix domain-containing protein n=1 Tax=Nitratireductor TaxID=245876 RepID=UPI000D0E09AD|nr:MULTISPECIES: helix-turn-helix transcriptional regulator [Nitratireductor]PSM19568.1 hypothetical protein C7T96_00260 [Nitratireductor sp. StC3]
MHTSRKPDERDKQMGRVLAHHRKAAGQSQAELARQLGLSGQQVGKYERGESRIPAGRFEEAMAILGAQEAAPDGFGEEGRPYRVSDNARADVLRLLDRLRSDLETCIEQVKRL